MSNPDNSLSRGRAHWLRISVQGWVALAFFLLGVIFYFLIPSQIEEPKLLLGRSFMDMEPTLFPRLATIGLCIMSAILFLVSVRNPEENPFKVMSLKSYAQMARFIFILYIFAVLFEPLGFLISSTIVVGALSYFLGNRNPYTLGLLALSVPTAIYFVFTRLLLVSLPGAPLME